MTAEEFLQKLEQADLAPPEIVASLRRQVAAAKEPIPPANIAKLLVEKGHLTANQSQRLLGNPGTSSIIGKAQSPAAPSAATPSTIQKKAAASGVQKPPTASQAPAQPKSAPPKSQPKPQTSPAPASPSSSNILDDLGLMPLDDLSGSPSTLAATSNIHSGTHPKQVARSPSLSSSNVLDDVGLSPLGDSSLGAKSAAKSTPASSLSKIDDLGLVSDEAPSRAAPPPGSLAAKLAAQEALKQQQDAAESKSSIQNVAATQAAIQRLAAASGKSQIHKPAPAVVTPDPLPGLDELSPIDDLASLDLNSLSDMSPLEAPSPLSTSPLVGSPLGGDPLSAGLDPLAGPADLGALAAQTAAPLGRPAPAAIAAVAAANESRTTMMVGGIMGGAALLVVVIGLAVYFWPRGSGQLEFQAAEQAYQEKAYPAAIEKYDALLRLFPRHDQASLARVHRGLCQIQVANPGSGDWPRLLPVVREVTNQLALEPELPQVHAELAPLLVQQCEALVDAATRLRPGDDLPTKLQEAQAALALCNDARLLPSPLRPWQKLAEIEERLQVLARDQARTAAREQARGSLAQLASAGNVAAFYQERAKTLAAFPELATEGMWTELGTSLAESAPQSAKVSATKKPAVSELPPSPWLKNIPWQALAVAPANDEAAAGRVAIVNAAGAIHGIDTATGKVRWSRFVGAPPSEAPVTSSDGNRLWVVDRARHALLCLQTAKGEWSWSQPLASSAVGSPVLAGDRLYLTLANGSVQALDAASGELLATAELPQPAGARLCLTEDGKQIAQVADAGLLYLLNAETLQTERAVYLGHERGAVRFAPVVFLQQWIVAARRGEQTELHAISLAAGKVDVKRTTLDGVIGAALLVSGRRLLVPTETGKIGVLEGDGSEPLRLTSTLETPSGKPVVRHLSHSAGGVLAADQGCALLKFNSQGKLEPGWSAFGGDCCDSGALLVGETVLATHYSPAQSILWVSGVNSSDGQVAWQCPLSCSLNLIANADAGAAPIALATQNIPPDLMGAISTAVRPRANFDFALLSSDRLAMVERGRPELLTYVRSSESATPWQARSLTLPGGALAGIPALVGQHLLVPLSDGSIQCLDPNTGEPTAAPFVLPGGSGLLPPVVLAIGEKGQEALVFDGGRSLVKIGRVEQPQPHWGEQAAVRSNQPFAAAPVLLDNTVFAVDRRGLVQTFAIPDLAVGQTHELSHASAAWGPHRCGEAVLLATDGDELVCLDATRLPRWQQALPQGPLAGLPLAHQNNVILLSRSGLIEVRALGTGDVIGNLDLRQPLAGPALVAGNTLWLTTAAGQVLHVTIPTAKESAQESP